MATWKMDADDNDCNDYGGNDETELNRELERPQRGPRATEI